MTIKFTVPGIPVGKGRPRITATHAYTPKRTKDYENLVRGCWLQQSNKRFPEGTEMEMHVDAYFPVPKSASKKKHLEMAGAYYSKKPDLDNVIKAIADALNGVAYDDDSHIVLVSGVKRFVNDGESPRVEITITDVAG